MNGRAVFVEPPGLERNEVLCLQSIARSNRTLSLDLNPSLVLIWIPIKAYLPSWYMKDMKNLLTPNSLLRLPLRFQMRAMLWTNLAFGLPKCSWMSQSVYMDHFSSFYTPRHFQSWPSIYMAVLGLVIFVNPLKFYLVLRLALSAVLFLPGCVRSFIYILLLTVCCTAVSRSRSSFRFGKPSVAS